MVSLNNDQLPGYTPFLFKIPTQNESLSSTSNRLQFSPATISNIESENITKGFIIDEYPILLEEDKYIYIILSSMIYQMKSAKGKFSDIDPLDDTFNISDLSNNCDNFLINFNEKSIKIQSINHKFIWYVFQFKIEDDQEKDRRIRKLQTKQINKLQEEIGILKNILTFERQIYLKSTLDYVCKHGSVMELEYLIKNNDFCVDQIKCVLHHINEFNEKKLDHFDNDTNIQHLYYIRQLEKLKVIKQFFPKQFNDKYIKSSIDSDDNVYIFDIKIYLSKLIYNIEYEYHSRHFVMQIRSPNIGTGVPLLNSGSVSIITHFYIKYNSDQIKNNRHTLNYSSWLQRAPEYINAELNSYKFDNKGCTLVLPIWVKEVYGRRSNYIDGVSYDDDITPFLCKIKDILSDLLL